MGDWNDSIYCNDCAMDLLADINENFDEKMNLIEFISDEVTKDLRFEAILVLADFELFLTGKVFFTSDVIEIIDKLLIEDMERWADTAEIREKELLTLKQEILDSKNSKPISRTNKEIKNWINEKRKLDIW